MANQSPPITFPPSTPAGTRQLIRENFPHYPVELFARVEDLFAGRYPGYQACDTPYHDLTHTCDVTTAVVRILLRRPTAQGELAVTAALLHDVGYLKETGDIVGTGAKYTATHVERGAQFAGKFLPAFAFTADQIRVVQQTIRCTSVEVDTSRIGFHNDRERFLGCVVGTADVLGQMASADYPARLPALYAELHEGGVTTCASVAELLRQTRRFFTGHVRRVLAEQWDGVAQHLPEYFPAIEANLTEIERRLG